MENSKSGPRPEARPGRQRGVYPEQSLGLTVEDGSPGDWIITGGRAMALGLHAADGDFVGVPVSHKGGTVYLAVIARGPLALQLEAWLQSQGELQRVMIDGTQTKH